MPSLTAGLMIGGGLLGGLGGLLQRRPREVMPSLINSQQYQQGLNMQTGAYDNANNQMAQMMRQANAYGGQGAGFLQSYMNQDPAQFNYDPLAAQRAFLGGAPQLQDLAQSSMGGTNEDLLRQEREMIMQQVGAGFGGSPRSGAYAQSASQALASPLLQRQSQMESNRLGLLGNLFNTSQNQLGQGFLTQAQGGFQADQENRNRFLQALQASQQQQATAMQGAGMFGNLAGGALGNLAQLQQPVYATPDYVTPFSRGANFFQGMMGGVGTGALAAGAFG